MVHRLPRISSRVLQCGKSTQKDSKRRDQAVRAANNDGLDSEGFLLFGEGDTLEAIVDCDLVIVFGKSFRPPVSRSTQSSL